MPSLVIEHDSAESAKAAVQGCTKVNSNRLFPHKSGVKSNFYLSINVKCKLPKPPGQMIPSRKSLGAGGKQRLNPSTLRDRRAIGDHGVMMSRTTSDLVC